VAGQAHHQRARPFKPVRHLQAGREMFGVIR
jgi:hypothetical protein